MQQGTIHSYSDVLTEARTRSKKVSIRRPYLWQTEPILARSKPDLMQHVWWRWQKKFWIGNACVIESSDVWQNQEHATNPRSAPCVGKKKLIERVRLTWMC